SVATIDHQVSQLNQLLGQQKYEPAVPLLRHFIARKEFPMAYESRAAGIWALGKILQGKKVPDLSPPLEQRLNDLNSIPPEDFRVRRMSAITLGRIQAKEAMGTLQKFCPVFQPSQ